MANKLKINRTAPGSYSSTGNPSSLDYGELAFNNGGEKIFIGKQTSASNNPIAGTHTDVFHLSTLKDLSGGTGITYQVSSGLGDNSGTVSVTPAQTGITSIHNASLEIGNADNDNIIDFSTANTISFKMNNASQKAIEITDTAVTISKGTSNIDFDVQDTSGVSAFKVDSGTGETTIANTLNLDGDLLLPTGDVLADDIVANSYHYRSYNSGTDTYSAGPEAFSIGASGGVTFNAALSLDNNLTVTTSTGAILRLDSSDTVITANDVLGRINFSAPSEASGTDAVALGASIAAVAQSVFDISTNKTDIVFYTAESGVADESMRIGWDKKVTIKGDLQVDGTTTTIDSTVVTIEDPIFTLGGDGSGIDDSKDRGIEFKWNNGTSAKVGFFGFNEDNQKFTYISDATNTSEVFSGTLGDVEFGTLVLNNSAGNLDGAHIDGGTFS
jgi:hypothetical protein